MYLLSASENGDVEVKILCTKELPVSMLKKGNFPQVCRRVSGFVYVTEARH